MIQHNWILKLVVVNNVGAISRQISNVWHETLKIVRALTIILFGRDIKEEVKGSMGIYWV